MDLFWQMFFFMAFVVIIMIFATISEVINKFGYIAKWLGLGAIAGNVININGEKVGVPFTIKAIGLPESLDALSRPGGYLEILKRYGIEAELKKSNDITIPKYTGKIEFKYGKSVK